MLAAGSIGEYMLLHHLCWSFQSLKLVFSITEGRMDKSYLIHRKKLTVYLKYVLLFCYFSRTKPHTIPPPLVVLVNSQLYNAFPDLSAARGSIMMKFTQIVCV